MDGTIKNSINVHKTTWKYARNKLIFNPFRDNVSDSLLNWVGRGGGGGWGYVCNPAISIKKHSDSPYNWNLFWSHTKNLLQGEIRKILYLNLVLTSKKQISKPFIFWNLGSICPLWIESYLCMYKNCRTAEGVQAVVFLFLKCVMYDGSNYPFPLPAPIF